jgi:LysR family transcriptional regulator, glycine cleavage system transcriptional activator
VLPSFVIMNTVCDINDIYASINRFVVKMSEVDLVKEAVTSRVAAPWRSRPIGVGHLRAFEAVAKHLNFRLAAEDLALTQSAISRQIQALEENVGVLLFLRHTRAVELTQAGVQLLSAVTPSLERIDQAVNQVRLRSGRRSITLTTFASLASMWLIPRLGKFQTEYPDIDLRIDASDHFVDLETSDLDLAIRYGSIAQMPLTASRMFGEHLTPVASPAMAQRVSLEKTSDLKKLTLIEDVGRVNAHHEWLTWRRWLHAFNQAKLEPKRWMYFSYAHQMYEAALAGQGVVLARTPLIAQQLQDGTLIEPIKHSRVNSPMIYWYELSPHAEQRPELQAFMRWLESEAELTRAAIGDVPEPDSQTGSLDD